MLELPPTPCFTDSMNHQPVGQKKLNKAARVGGQWGVREETTSLKWLTMLIWARAESETSHSFGQETLIWTDWWSCTRYQGRSWEIEGRPREEDRKFHSSDKGNIKEVKSRPIRWREPVEMPKVASRETDPLPTFVILIIQKITSEPRVIFLIPQVWYWVCLWWTTGHLD